MNAPPVCPVLRCLGLLLCVVTAAAAQPSDSHLPVYIEDSPAAQEMVAQAEQLREQDRLTDAISTLQRVIDEYGTKLMPVGDGLYEETGQWVRRRIADQPELLAAYRQVYGPEAERLLAAATAPPSTRDLESMFRRLFLTDAGLHAGLTLAGVYLERADTAAASSVLETLPTHPSFAREESLYHTLAATVALLSGDDAAFDRHRDRLRELNAADRLAQVEALSRQLHPPLRIARDRNVAPPEAPPLESLRAPLWDVRINRRTGNMESPLPYAQPSRESFPTMPVAGGDQVFINEGEAVMALDRYSGRRLWTYQPEEDTATGPMIARMGRTISDRRGVLLQRDRLFAVVGQATAWPIRGEGPNTSTALVCLDRVTGAVRWRITPGDLDASLSKAYFQGTPLAASDRVFVLLRRNQASGFQDAFVAAVDAATGEPLWRRHISSAVTASRYAAASPPTMTLHDGTLYVSDNLAAVAAVVGRIGALRWARVVLDPGDANARGLASGGETPVDVAPPVLCAAGLVVPPMGSDPSLLVLDPQSGAERRRVPMRDGDASYLLPAGDDVLGVGQAVTLLDGETLDVVWVSERQETRQDQAHPLAAVTRAYVVAPLGGRLVLFDRETGAVVREADLREGGNVLALDGQLVVADARAVRSFMAWEDAYAALARQADEQPIDPGPGLAMAHLAVTHGRIDSALEGVDAALAALEAAHRAAPPEVWLRMQAEAFEQVLAFASSEGIGDPSIRQQLFDRLASISSNASQEVAYHLALGRLLEELGRPAEAVEHYQAVLLDDTLSEQLYHHEDVARQASLEAMRRLEALVQAHGSDAYARFNILAASKLHELKSLNAGPDALMELAHRYPLASAAPLARLEAAEQLARTGRDREAAAQLRMAFRRSDDPLVAARVAARLAELYEQTGRPTQAIHWLRRVARERPELRLTRGGEPAPVSAWIADLASHESVGRIGAPLSLPLGQPYTLPGVMLTPLASGGEGGADAIALRSGGRLRLYRGDPLKQAWERPAPGGDAQLLVLAHDQLLFWSQDTGRLVALDAATGDPLWPALSTPALLEPLGTAAERAAQRPAEQREFMQMIDVNAPIVVRGGQVIIERPKPEPGYLIAVGDGVVCVADRLGGVVGVDRQTGRMLWQKAVPIERVAALTAHGDTLAMIGVSGVGTDAQSGVVQVLDLLTGEPRLPMLEDKSPPQWVGFAGEDLLIVATADQVTGHRMNDGGVIWRVGVEGAPLTGVGWASSDAVVLGVNGDGLLMLDADTGETLHRLFRQRVIGPGASTPTLVDDQWHLLASSAAMVLTSRGEERWRDAIEPGGHLVQQLIGDRYVVLLSAADAAAAAPAARMFPGDNRVDATDEPAYRLYVLERASGRIVDEYALDVPPGTIEPLRGTLLPNRIILAAGDRTLVVPGASPEAGD